MKETGQRSDAGGAVVPLESLREIRIAVASGKGGTGKTTLATNLAVALASTGARVAYVDCDVEEPNGHIFLSPTIHTSRHVSTLVPEVDHTRCTSCGACGRACRYSAIVALPNRVLTFPRLCHSCGGCVRVCPEGALREVPRQIGVIEEGIAGRITFWHGHLNIGEAMAPPLIRALLKASPIDRTVIIDSPPGTSCPVIESIKASGVVLLVTEPTPFGLNDLVLAVDMVRTLGLPFGVAINRAGIGDSGVSDYCTREHIPVMFEFPNDRGIAQAYSRGELAVAALPHWQPRFVDLARRLQTLAETLPARVAPIDRHATEHVPATPEPVPSTMVTIGHPRQVRELVVISGKGGTGKTSLVASFVALAGQTAITDCDVDAADLHLVLNPTVRRREPFSGGHVAVIDPALCTGCGLCAAYCRFDAIRKADGRRGISWEVDTVSCEGCGVCVDVCPQHAARLVPSVNGEWYLSDTPYGPMVHARLGPAQGNSGKLVSLVRREAKACARSTGLGLLICDGSPGIGCPVIASITGATLVLIVTEPTLSGLHDLTRVAELCRQMNLEAGICTNKADINPEVARQIEAEGSMRGIPVLGRVRYDDSITSAQLKRMAVVELGEGPAATDIRALWERVQEALTSPPATRHTSRGIIP